MTCRKCAATMPANAIFCHLCGVRQQGAGKPSRKGRTRPNGAGTAYKRGKTWTAVVVRGWKTVEKNGKPKQLPVYATKGGFATKREALEHCAIMRSGKSKKGKSLTFSDVYDAWEPGHMEKISKHTLGCYRAAKAYFGDLFYMPFSEIGLDDWQDCVDSCKKGRRTKENMRTLAGLLYKYALPRHHAEMNYADYLHVGADEKGTHPAFSTEQLQTIKNNIGKVAYADYIYVLCYTGFRPGELLAMKKDALDLNENTLTGGSKTEAGKNRVVTLSPKILPTVLQLHRAPGDLLFPRKSDGAPLIYNYFRKFCFTPALEQMGIEGDFVPYSCRHTFANLMKAVGGADVDKAALMGHTSYDMTRYYQSADLASKRLITDAL